MDITVLGHHRYVSKPDVGLLTLLAQVDRDTPADAAATVLSLAADVTAALDDLSSPHGPVTWHTVDPLVTAAIPDDAATSLGNSRVHRASVRLRARFDDPAGLASFLGSWATRRDVLTLGVSWELSDELRSALDHHALQEAVTDAYHRAHTIALAAGASDVEAMSFSDPEHTDGTPPGILTHGQGGAPEGGAASPIIPDDVEGHVSIKGQFRAIRTTVLEGGSSSPRRAW